MLPEYDFSDAVRGKYFDQYRQGANIVLLDRDVAEVFHDAAAVNDALRSLIAVAEAKTSRRQAQTRRAKKAPHPAGHARRNAKR